MNSKPNIDPEEIAKFDALATEWWDPNGPMQPLHRMNPVRLAFIQQHAKLDAANVLDIGCGAGLLAEGLTQAGAHVTAIDQSESALNIARQHAAENNLTIDYQKAEIEQFAAENTGKFAVVTCLELLEHVPNPASVIAACCTLLKPGGQVFFSTINRNAVAYLQAIIGAEYILGLLPKGTHEYKKFIKPSELSAWAREHALQLTALKGLSYHPLQRTFSLSSNVKTNYIACFTRAELA